MKLEMIPPMHVREGDMFAGQYNPDAPTTPVQPNAHALRVRKVHEIETDEGPATYFDFGRTVPMLSRVYPRRGGLRVLVIRDAHSES